MRAWREENPRDRAPSYPRNRGDEDLLRRLHSVAACRLRSPEVERGA